MLASSSGSITMRPAATCSRIVTSDRIMIGEPTGGPRDRSGARQWVVHPGVAVGEVAAHEGRRDGGLDIFEKHAVIRGRGARTLVVIEVRRERDALGVARQQLDRRLVGTG